MFRLALILALLSSTALHAQQPAPGVPGELAPRGGAPASMGTVPTHDALVTGGLEVHGDSARLLTNASVTAYDHSAAITLARGGEVLVCATSQFHLLHSGTESSLLFGLDRGAFELHTDSSPQDVILTPDIRFTLEHPGHYDLRLRVTPNGDTCVENSGTTAPVLSLADPFSGATYRLIPGQHVLFEHGSLHEVVDNERSPCGCPPAPPPPIQQIASTPKSDPSQPATPAAAAAEHPFPAAASQGLAPTPSPAHTPTPAGQQQTQVATNLTYDAAHPNTPPPSTIEPPKPAATTGSTSGSPTGTGDANASPTPPPTPPGPHDLFHVIGHLFHKIFHHEDKPAAPPQ
jgi:hypothetical protein